MPGVPENWTEKWGRGRSGEVLRIWIHRMSGPVVVIGYLFLIPSVIMMTSFGGCAIKGLVVAGSATTVGRTDAIEAMVGVGISESSAEALLDDSSLPITDGTYTEALITAIDAARSDYSTAEAAAGLGGVSVIVSMVGIVGSFVGGLLGWILIMKKTVLQCTSCQAVVNAS